MITTYGHDDMMTRHNLYRFLLVALPLLLLPSIVVAQQPRSETGCRSREELVKLRKEFFAQELELTADITKLETIIKAHYKQLYAKRLNNTEEMSNS